MNYEEFIEYVKENLAACYKDIILTEEIDNNGLHKEGQQKELDKCEVVVQKVVKNNGIQLDAVSIYEEGERVSPNIYLKPFYDSYMMGKPLDFVMTEIVFRYRNEKAETDFDYIDLNEYDEIKNDIVLRLINYERNKDMLEGCPYIKYLDLAISFRYVIKESALGLASILITNREFERWKISVDELYRKALSNSMQKYPWCMEPLSKLVLECFDDRIKNELNQEIVDVLQSNDNLDLGVNLYVMTNRTKAFGAGCILYDDVISNFARVQEANVFILPSSVHEVMLLPEEDDISAQFLLELLTEANRSSVGLIDLLSDNIYYYDRNADEITICNV